jgi:hypothetical protein
MTKTDVLNRVTLKSETATKSIAQKEQVKQVAKVIDLNAPANKRQTYALYNANRAASKIDGCKVFNDWHLQNLTVGECNTLIAEYNKVTGYVYTPKVKTAKEPKKVVPTTKGTSKGKAVKANEGAQIEIREIKHNPTMTVRNSAQIQALKDLRKEGLLTVDELVQALKALQD